jgi:uncharacterized membrane protein
VVKPRNDLGLVVVAAAAACLAAAVLPSSVAVLRAVLAVPLVLALPGYAVVTAIFRPHELRGPELLTLSIAISIAATIFSGLLLDALGVHLTTAPWMGVLAVLTIAAAAVAAARGHARSVVLPEIRLRVIELGALFAGLALLVGAATLGFTPLSAPKLTRGTSALWLLPAPAGARDVCVGVINEQLHTTTYTVSVMVAGRTPRRLGPITLAPSQSWERTFAVGAGRPAVTATLRRSGGTGVYRSVALRDWNIAASHC